MNNNNDHIKVTSCIESKDSLLVIEDRYLPVKSSNAVINSVCKLGAETFVFLEKGQVYRLNTCGRDTKIKQWAEKVHKTGHRGGQTVISIE